jgi:protein gp37
VSEIEVKRRGSHGRQLFGDDANEVAEVKDGSARIALGIDPSFDRYIFIDRAKGHVKALEALREEFPKRKIDVQNGDANQVLKDFCQSINWQKTRAAVFIDPYGMQVNWSTAPAPQSCDEMAGRSDIEWTEATWNPVAGCAMVSPGCTNCYAQRMAARLEAMGMEKYAGTTRKSGRRAVWTGHVNFDESSLVAPLKWRTPLRIFANSMSDLFQDSVPERFISRVWQVMEKAHWHSFQILTMRAERMHKVLGDSSYPILRNVWLGTSVESQDYAGRIQLLRETPAHIRFVSFEPLIGPVLEVDLSGVHWAIVGGESGPGARPMETWWVEELRDSCREQGVAFFFKQWGGVHKGRAGRTLEGRTWDEYPAAVAS